VLETGSVEALQHYARDLSERIIPRGMETHEVVGIVLLLRDVLARSVCDTAAKAGKRAEQGVAEAKRSAVFGVEVDHRQDCQVKMSRLRMRAVWSGRLGQDLDLLKCQLTST
jgi:hypothetical protein